jgi:hypothetical protein
MVSMMALRSCTGGPSREKKSVGVNNTQEETHCSSHKMRTGCCGAMPGELASHWFATLFPGEESSDICVSHGSKGEGPSGLWARPRRNDGVATPASCTVLVPTCIPAPHPSVGITKRYSCCFRLFAGSQDDDHAWSSSACMNGWSLLLTSLLSYQCSGGIDCTWIESSKRQHERQAGGTPLPVLSPFEAARRARRSGF